MEFILKYFFNFWWLFLPFILGLIVWEKRLMTVRSLYNANLRWSFLELKIPARVEKSIQSMEEVFTALHSVFLKGSDYKRYFKGYQPPHFVFILICHNGFLKFYIRTLETLKNFVKTRIYAQYPTAEINEVPDPFSFLPPIVPNPLMNCFIAEMKTAKKEPYPIKTYRTWERIPTEERIDPLSFLAEAASQLKNDEWVAFQIFAMPVPDNDEDFGNKWTEVGKKEVNKLIGKKETAEPNPLEAIVEFILNLLKAPFTQPTWKEQKTESSEVLMQKLTPGELEVVRKFQEKLSKPGFLTGIRAMYLSLGGNFKEKMARSVGLIFSFLKLYEVQNMNSFKPAKTTTPKEIVSPLTLRPKEETREIYLKGLMYNAFKSYFPPEDRFILNVEEIASLFHIPLETISPTTIEKTLITQKPSPPIIPEPENF